MAWLALRVGCRRQILWMDTFCIPIDNGDTQDLDHVKHAAIQGMNTACALATATLVIDLELQQIPRSADLPTIFANIHSCGWGTRGWTFQERNLSWKCLFALLDSVVDLQADLPKFPFKAHDLIWSLTSELQGSGRTSNLGIWTSTVNMRHSAEMAAKFVNIWNSLLEQATGQPKDVPVILANLLCLSACRVLQAPDTILQIAMILNSLPYLPLSLFYHKGPRQNEQDRGSQEDVLVQILTRPRKMNKRLRMYFWRRENLSSEDEEMAFVLPMAEKIIFCYHWQGQKLENYKCTK
ncbi:hypothetical protein B0J14DRAFT_92636 [Halenospora varia]|nr:hypothetical protein B0J14DRAFT_92636 [Halenospora varia]